MGRVLIVADSGHWLGFAEGLKRLDKTESEITICRSAGYCRSRGGGVIDFPNVNVGDAEHADLLASRHSLVVSLHCQQIFHRNLTKHTLCVNLHPGLLPYGRGWNPYVFALANQTGAGATLHVIDDKVDHGRIIAVQSVPLKPTDTCDKLYVRVQKAEEALITKWLPRFIVGDWGGALSPFPEPQPRPNTKKDYDELCKLDLDELTGRQLLNRLAALTYEDQMNAYCIDANGEKLHIGVSFGREV